MIDTIYTYFEAVTPHDTNPAPAHSALWIGGAGTVVVVTRKPAAFGPGTPDYADDPTVTFTAVPAGSILPISVYKIMAASTATLIIAMR